MATWTLGLARDPSILAPDAVTADLRGVDVLLFPELVDGGYAALRRGEGNHTEDDEFIERFRRFSRTKRRCVVAGSVRLAAPTGKGTNSCLVFQGGRRIHRYDKIHMFRPCGDHTLFRTGERVGTFTFAVGGRRIRGGVVICYDLRFPELVRVMALRGIHVLFVPARWPAARDRAWHTLLRARAIENQIFVAGCNAGDREGGASYVFDPLGEEILRWGADDPAPVARTLIDTGLIGTAHRMHRNIAEAIVLRASTIPARVRRGRRGRSEQRR